MKYIAYKPYNWKVDYTDWNSLELTTKIAIYTSNSIDCFSPTIPID